MRSWNGNNRKIKSSNLVSINSCQHSWFDDHKDDYLKIIFKFTVIRMITIQDYSKAKNHINKITSRFMIWLIKTHHRIIFKFTVTIEWLAFKESFSRSRNRHHWKIKDSNRTCIISETYINISNLILTYTHGHNAVKGTSLLTKFTRQTSNPT